MRYAIIGSGAIGGYYGAKLAHAGREVHFLLRSDYEYVKQHGLQINSCDGSFHLADVNASSFLITTYVGRYPVCGHETIGLADRPFCEKAW